MLHNALHHTPVGAKVTVQAGIEPMTATGNGVQHAVLRVIDTGPGMPPADQLRAGERFFRGSSPASGSGLGLAIAQAIALRHGGGLSLRNTSPDPSAPGLTVALHWPHETQ